MSRFRWAVSAFEEKRDGQGRLSMTRLAVAFFTGAEVYRLLAREPIGWPDAFLAAVVLFALPISKALDTAPAQSVVDAIAGMFGRGAVGGRDDARDYGPRPYDGPEGQ